jgi:uncharacterized membrane protein YidH (DUF202 family)
VSAPSGPVFARERTLLAWTRTTIAAVVVAALLARFAQQGRAPVAGELAAAVALALAGVAWWASHRRRSRDRYERWSLFALSAGVVAVAGAAVIAVGLALT